IKVICDYLSSYVESGKAETVSRPVTASTSASEKVAASMEKRAQEQGKSAEREQKNTSPKKEAQVAVEAAVNDATDATDMVEAEAEEVTAHRGSRRRASGEASVLKKHDDAQKDDLDR